MVVSNATKAKYISRECAIKLREQLRQHEEERTKLMESMRTMKTQNAHDNLSEDIGFQRVQEELDYIQEQIENISHCLLRAEIMKEPADTNTVHLGSTVRLSDSNSEVSLMIVESVEADPLEGKISDTSPIGQALLGKSLHEEVEVPTPRKRGILSHWKIMSIS